MKKIWTKKFSSLKEAEEFDIEYYRQKTPDERLSDMQFCREMYFNIKGIDVNACRKRLRRVLRVIQ